MEKGAEAGMGGAESKARRVWEGGPPGAALEGEGPGGARIWRVDSTLPIDPALGAWAVGRGLFARGSDFSGSIFEGSPGHEGSSRFLKVWGGAEGKAQGADLCLWVAERGGEALACALWERAPAAELWAAERPGGNANPKRELSWELLGSLGFFTRKEARGAGLAKALAAAAFGPIRERSAAARSAGRLPALCAEAAARRLCEAESAWGEMAFIGPVNLREFGVGSGIRSDLWHEAQQILLARHDGDVDWSPALRAIEKAPRARAKARGPKAGG